MPPSTDDCSSTSVGILYTARPDLKATPNNRRIDLLHADPFSRHAGHRVKGPVAGSGRHPRLCRTHQRQSWMAGLRPPWCVRKRITSER
jgi:hypothetical protein